MRYDAFLRVATLMFNRDVLGAINMEVRTTRPLCDADADARTFPRRSQNKAPKFMYFCSRYLGLFTLM